MSFPCWLWAIFVSLPHYFKLLEEEFTLCPLRYLQGLGHQEDMELDNWHDLSGNSKWISLGFPSRDGQSFFHSAREQIAPSQNFLLLSHSISKIIFFMAYWFLIWIRKAKKLKLVLSTWVGSRGESYFLLTTKSVSFSLPSSFFCSFIVHSAEFFLCSENSVINMTGKVDTSWCLYYGRGAYDSLHIGFQRCLHSWTCGCATLHGIRDL